MRAVRHTILGDNNHISALAGAKPGTLPVAAPLARPSRRRGRAVLAAASWSLHFSPARLLRSPPPPRRRSRAVERVRSGLAVAVAGAVGSGAVGMSPRPARPRGRGRSDAAPQAGPQQPARRRRARGAPLTGAARSGPAGPFLLLSSNKCCSQSGVSLTRHCCGISSPSDSTICYFEWSLGRSHCSMMSFLYLCLWVEHSLHLSITPITPCRQQQ